MALALIINIVFNLFCIFFILRMTIDEREFFFSPMLQPVYRVTEPVLRIMQGRITFFDHHRNLSGALVIFVLVLLRGLILSFLTTKVMLYSVLSFTMAYVMPHSMELSIALSFLNFIDLLFQVFFVLIISYILAPTYSTNPIIRFTNSVLDPFLKLTARIFYFFKRGIPVLTAVLMIICHFVMVVFCLYLMSLDIERSLEPLLAGGMYTQPVDEPDGQPRLPDQQFNYPKIFYSTLNLVFSAFGFFTIVIIIGAVMSWFRPDPFNPLVQWIETVNGPILAPLRKYIPLLGGIDLSPIVAILIIEFGRQWLDILSLQLLSLYF